VSVAAEEDRAKRLGTTSRHRFGLIATGTMHCP
jgi:hypothetical protein